MTIKKEEFKNGLPFNHADHVKIAKTVKEKGLEPAEFAEMLGMSVEEFLKLAEGARPGEDLRPIGVRMDLICTNCSSSKHRHCAGIINDYHDKTMPRYHPCECLACDREHRVRIGVRNTGREKNETRKNYGLEMSLGRLYCN